MKMNLYAVYDLVDGSYGAPMMFRTDGTFVRQILRMFSGHKELRLDDYRCYCIGTFDDEQGILTDDNKHVVDLPVNGETEEGV